MLLPYASTEALQIIFALFMLTVGIYGASSRIGSCWAAAAAGGNKLGVASAIGCLAALTGTGGGTLTTPVLQAFSMKLELAIATASATGLVTGTVATIGAIVGGWRTPDLPGYSLGYVDLAIFAAMMPAIMIAAPFGVRAGHRMS